MEITAVHCDCGFEARASDEDGLVEEIRRHALEQHGMELSHDEALVLALRAEGQQRPPAIARRKTGANGGEAQ